jgi:ubiquitin-associated SH3 domain-containing protein
MDRIFPGWTRLAFTDLGKYRPYDLNQPLTLPKRSGGPAHFHNDTPITEMGYVSSQMIGRGMRLNRVNVATIYCSPALRCVQTAFGLLKTLNAPCKIRVEPGLFEWLAWYDTPPTWMSRDEMEAAGYPIDTSYRSYVDAGTLFKTHLKETSAQHYERNHSVIQHILNNNPEKGAILIIGHGTSLDAARRVLGRPVDQLSRAEMDRMGLHYPYCSVVAMEELANQAWRVIHNPIPSITYLDFSNRLNFQFFNR